MAIASAESVPPVDVVVVGGAVVVVVVGGVVVVVGGVVVVVVGGVVVVALAPPQAETSKARVKAVTASTENDPFFIVISPLFI
jgi:hypothetical protein